jgi:hypothetical protein
MISPATSPIERHIQTSNAVFEDFSVSEWNIKKLPKNYEQIKYKSGNSRTVE